MIAYLRGNVMFSQPGELVLMVGGVGYRVTVKRGLLGNEGRSTLNDETGTLYEGACIGLLIRTVVKEDAIDLYGFQFEADEAIFLAVTAIKGCGPKLAMNILSNISAEDFNRAVQEKDLKRLTSIKGVGEKTARAILEAFS